MDQEMVQNSWVRANHLTKRLFQTVRGPETGRARMQGRVRLRSKHSTLLRQQNAGNKLALVPKGSLIVCSKALKTRCHAGEKHRLKTCRVWVRQGFQIRQGESACSTEHDYIRRYMSSLYRQCLTAW
jgi:hypothetical protein